jgi:hypothetical protein
MNYIVVALVLISVTFLAFGTLTKRIKVSNCCATANPENDLRMRAAFTPRD